MFAIAAFLLALLATYVGVKSVTARLSAPATEMSTQVVSVSKPLAVSPVAASVDVAPPPAPAEPATQSVASIENVATPTPSAMPPAASMPVAQQGVDAAGSINNIQRALESPQPAQAPSVKPVQARSATKATAPAKTAKAIERPPLKTAARSSDEDAALIAAMLPHIKGAAVLPVSPAYAKRCGQFSGAAEAECRARFCNGREGADAACPAPASR